MTEHITISLNAEELALARAAAEARGVATEVYLRQLIADNLPQDEPADRQQQLLSKIFGMGSSAEPTNIARDKDRMIGEAVWDEHLRETRQE